MKETGSEPDIAKRLTEIQQSITVLEKKMADKWVLPVLIVIITAAMTATNFLITRHFENGDIYGNKLKEKIAELRATQTIDFFSKSIKDLDNLNETFHSICQFGLSGKDIAQYNVTIVNLNTLIDIQMTMDTAVVNRIGRYKDFVAKKELAMENKKLPANQWTQLYTQSNLLYVDCIRQINASLTMLTEK
jgi:hypothetical protein